MKPRLQLLLAMGWLISAILLTLPVMAGQQCHSGYGNELGVASQSGTGLRAILAKLDKTGVPYQIFENSDHLISRGEVDRDTFVRPIKIVIVLKDNKQRPRPLWRDEVITMIFDNQSKLIGYYCKVIFTGP